MKNFNKTKALEIIRSGYKNGFSYKRIAELLNAEKLTGVRGGGWSPGGVNKFLMVNDPEFFEKHRRNKKSERPRKQENMKPGQLDFLNKQMDQALETINKKIPADFPQPEPKPIKLTKNRIPEKPYSDLAEQARKTGKQFIELAELLNKLESVKQEKTELENKVQELQNKLNQNPVYPKQATINIPDKSTRAKIREHIDNYCYLSGANHEQLYNSIYRQFRYIYGINIPVKTKCINNNSSIKKFSCLEIAEQENLIEPLYKLVKQMIPETDPGELLNKSISDSELKTGV